MSYTIVFNFMYTFIAKLAKKYFYEKSASKCNDVKQIKKLNLMQLQPVMKCNCIYYRTAIFTLFNKNL